MPSQSPTLSLRHVALVGLVALACSACAGAVFQAGVSKVDATMPIGTPLAGYNYAPRKSKTYPVPNFGKYTTFMNGSEGVRDPNYVKVLVLDTGSEQIALCTMDAIGADGTLGYLAWSMAAAQGFPIPFNKTTFHAAHTHSGPGGISPEFLWSVAPATDLMVPSLQHLYASKLAEAMVSAYKGLQPAKLGLGIGELIGFTHNRRSGQSPYEWPGKIDPNLGVFRVDDAATGAPIATVWNFAIHGICFDAPNMHFSSDIMGAVCDNIEKQGGGTALFINSDAGDINPEFSKCCTTNGTVDLHGGPPIAQKVMEVRNTITATDVVEITTASQTIDFGPTSLNLTLARVANCTRGGPIDICSICNFLKCDENIHLDEAWVENQPRFNAIKFRLDNTQDVMMVSVPGEALVDLGWEIKNDTLAMGYNQTFLLGYTNNHLGYFATPVEYDIGGYESLLTFWGIQTTNMIRSGARGVAQMLTPEDRWIHDDLESRLRESRRATATRPVSNSDRVAVLSRAAGDAVHNRARLRGQKPMPIKA